MVDPYTCPRCGLTTQLKCNMKTHLYNKKNVCHPLSQRHNFELTDTIKDYIMSHRVYQYVFEQNMVIHDIKSMSFTEITRKYFMFQGAGVIPINLWIWHTFKDEVIAFKQDTIKTYIKISVSNVEKIFRGTVKSKHINILSDPENDVILLKGKSDYLNYFSIDEAYQEIMKIINEEYFKHIEFYIIRKCENGSTEVKSKALQELNKHYHTLAVLKMRPMVINTFDNDILYPLGNNTVESTSALSTKYSNIFNIVSQCDVAVENIQKLVACIKFTGKMNFKIMLDNYITNKSITIPKTTK